MRIFFVTILMIFWLEVYFLSVYGQDEGYVGLSVENYEKYISLMEKSKLQVNLDFYLPSYDLEKIYIVRKLQGKEEPLNLSVPFSGMLATIYRKSVDLVSDFNHDKDSLITGAFPPISIKIFFLESEDGELNFVLIRKDQLVFEKIEINSVSEELRAKWKRRFINIKTITDEVRINE